MRRAGGPLAGSVPIVDAASDWRIPLDADPSM